MSGRQDYEKLGSFYLGRTIESPEGDPGPEQVLYDSRDLTTHAVIVGMTGSGKTGLGIALLEEAAIDGIPSIAIDVKGDLTNLFLTFPELRAGDFRPWIDEGAAARNGVTPDALAESIAESWRKGLAQWDQAPDRIERLRASVDLALFTPGSNSGTPISLLGTLDAPAVGLREDSDAMRDRIAGTVSGLLTLVGIDPDPVRSREHILLSGILDTAWRAGRSLALADLIRSVQAPPFSSVGVVDLESFFPAGDRAALAMLLNNLLASPGFQVWREGEPLDIDRLLSTPDGRPRLSVLYIAHLSDAERMFFVTRLLHEIVAWMRTQSGTGSLRALLYMDEVFGYFPPTANPPSKTPLLTLMKQARAFGLGVVLATQNPVDLDYKGLSNAGTWMLGRLQTERDKARVLDGLEGASSGAGFDRQEMDRVLSALGKRRFVLHSVHEAGPVLFHTRWVMSYLAGPLSVAQVRTLSASIGAAPPGRSVTTGTRPGLSGTATPDGASVGAGSAAGGFSVPRTAPAGLRPLLPHDVPEVFIDLGRHVPDPSRLRYTPCLLASARVRYVKADLKLDVWQETSVLTGLDAHPDWGSGEPFSGLAQAASPIEGASFDALPGEGARSASYREWGGAFRDWLYHDRPYGLWQCAVLDAVSEPGESEASFRMRLRLSARERRDAEVDELRSRYAARLQTIQRRVQAAEDRLTREEGQYGQQKLSAALGVGTSILGALFGGRGRTSLSGASQAARGLGRAAQERTDVRLAQEKVEAARAELAAMEQELAADVEALGARYEPEALVVEAVRVPARKSDIEVTRLVLAWTPWLDGATPERAWLPPGT